MKRYSIEPRTRKCIKGDRFLLFAKKELNTCKQVVNKACTVLGNKIADNVTKSNDNNNELKSVAIPLARGNLLGLVSNLRSSAINIFNRKISEKELSEQEKDLLYLFQMKIWITKIIKSLEDLRVLIDGV